MSVLAGKMKVGLPTFMLTANEPTTVQTYGHENYCPTCAGVKPEIKTGLAVFRIKSYFLPVTLMTWYPNWVFTGPTTLPGSFSKATVSNSGTI